MGRLSRKVNNFFIWWPIVTILVLNDRKWRAFNVLWFNFSDFGRSFVIRAKKSKKKNFLLDDWKRLKLRLIIKEGVYFQFRVEKVQKSFWLSRNLQVSSIFLLMLASQHSHCVNERARHSMNRVKSTHVLKWVSLWPGPWSALTWSPNLKEHPYWLAGHRFCFLLNVIPTFESFFTWTLGP